MNEWGHAEYAILCWESRGGELDTHAQQPAHYCGVSIPLVGESTKLAVYGIIDIIKQAFSVLLESYIILSKHDLQFRRKEMLKMRLKL